MRSFKSNENIRKKEGGSYYVVSANKASSVTLTLKCLTKFSAFHQGCADKHRFTHFLKFTKFSILPQFLKNSCLLDKREAVEWSGCCSSVGRLRYPIWEMNVSTDQWRRIGLFHNHSIITSCVGIRIDLVLILNWFYNITRLLKRCCVCLDILLHINFCNNFFTIILFLLLLSAGDVERNPGPDQTTHDLSIFQLNTRSIRNKLDFIKDNFMDSNILRFTETHLDINIQTDFLHIPNYSEPYRKDRNCHGGGIWCI